MAPVKSTFTLRHSVFIPFEYSAGEQPPFADEVENVVRTADTILGKRGYFTSTFDEPSSGAQYYMIGFKRPSESGVQRQSERLFDLYFANVEDLEGKDLRAIVERLREFPGRARTPTENVAEEVTVEVKKSPGARGPDDRRHSDSAHRQQSGTTAKSTADADVGPRDDSGERRDDGRDEPGKEIHESLFGDGSQASDDESQTPSDGRGTGGSWSPSPSQSRDRIAVPSVDETTADFGVGTVAAVWEQYRQSGSKPIRATLRELSYFTATVEGSLPKFKIVESGDGDVRHFNVVVGERVRQKQYQTLEQLLQHRQPRSWDDLPSYQDELDAYRDHYESKLREEASYSAEVDELLDEFGHKLDEVVEHHVERAVELYSSQFERSQSTDDDGGFGLSGVTGMLSGGEDDAVRRIKNETATNRVSEAEKEKIAKEMMGDVRDEVWDDVEETVRSELMEELEKLVDDHAESMAKEVVSKVDTVKRLESYDEV